MDNAAVEKRKYIWQIQNFVPKAIGGCMGSALTSAPFEIQLGKNKTRWRFKMIPNSDNCYCEFFICKEAANFENFTINLKVALQNSCGKIAAIRELERESSELETGKGWGWNQFMKLGNIVDESKKFINAGTLTFVIEVGLYQNNSLKLDYPSNNISDVIAKLFNTKDFSDLTIICSDGVSFKAHRCVLASRSPVFKEMLTPKIFEAVANELPINDIEGCTMLEILRFMYTDQIEDLGLHVAKLLKASIKYDIPSLKTLCCSKLIGEISMDNVFATMLLAHAHGEEKMLQKCMEFLKMNHRELKDMEQWKKVDAELMVKYVAFLQDGDIDSTILPPSSL